MPMCWNDAIVAVIAIVVVVILLTIFFWMTSCCTSCDQHECRTMKRQFRYIDTRNEHEDGLSYNSDNT